MADGLCLPSSVEKNYLKARSEVLGSEKGLG